MAQAELVELKESIYGVCDAIVELHGTLRGLDGIIDDFDTLSKKYPSLEVQNKKNFGAFITRLLQQLHIGGKWPFSAVVRQLETWLTNLRARGIDRDHPQNWLFFFKAVPVEGILPFLRRVRAINANFRKNYEVQFNRYSRYQRFPAYFVERYKRNFDQFLVFEHKIDEVLPRIETLLQLMNDDEKNLNKIISSELAGRYRYSLNLPTYYDALRGKLFLTVIFDYHGQHLYDVADGAQEARDWINFFIDLSGQYNLSFPELTAANAIMIKTVIADLLRKEGELFAELYLADKLDLNLNFYIVEKSRHRGFVLTSEHKRQSRKVKVEFNENQRVLNVFVNVERLRGWFESSRAGAYDIYTDFSRFLIHELGHVRDKRLSRKKITNLATLARRYREEGIALYSEYLASKTSATVGFGWHNMYSTNPIDSYETMLRVETETESHVYWLGFHMTLAVMGAALFSTFHIDRKNFTPQFMDGVRTDPKYIKFARDYIRLLRNMKLHLFFKKYDEAAIYLGILPVFDHRFNGLIVGRSR